MFLLLFPTGHDHDPGLRPGEELHPESQRHGRHQPDLLLPQHHLQQVLLIQIMGCYHVCLFHHIYLLLTSKYLPKCLK